jgi:hypothetical protein
MDSAGASIELPAPAGHGLIGMRERALACGGSLTARQDACGMFCVVAVIPHLATSPPAITMTSAQDALPRRLGRAQSVGPT